MLQRYDRACKKAGQPAIKILRFTGDQDALLALKSGRAQGSVTDYVVAASRSADPKQKLDTVALKGTAVPWGIAMKPTEKRLIAAVRGALNSLIKSGTYRKILAAYKMERLAIPSATINAGKE